MAEVARLMPTCFEDSMSNVIANYLSSLKKSWRAVRFEPWITGFQSRCSPFELAGPGITTFQFKSTFFIFLVGVCLNQFRHDNSNEKFASDFLSKI